jgi:hypothetical protein
LSNHSRSGSIAVFGQGQDASAQRLRGFPLHIVERAGVQGIRQGQQLVTVGWVFLSTENRDSCSWWNRLSHICVWCRTEAPNHSGAHTNGETVSWLVLEAGVWTLPGGVQLAVGRVSTAATVGRLLTNPWQSIPFSDPFPATPVVLSQVQTNNDLHRVGTRQEAVTASGFQVATFAALSAGTFALLSAGLEEEEANTAAHGTEVVGWLAIEPGQGSGPFRAGYFRRFRMMYASRASPEPTD